MHSHAGYGRWPARLGPFSIARLSSRRAGCTLAGQRDSSVGRSLAVAVLGFFVVTLDALVVNVALPAIGRDLGGGITGLQWVVDGYTLMFAALLLSAGALSDRIGARRAYGVGLVLFVAASAACGLAPNLASWRLIFAINLPVGAVALAGPPGIAAGNRGPAPRRRGRAGCGRGQPALTAPAW